MSKPETTEAAGPIRLHGHTLDDNMAVAGAAEAIGTFILVLSIAGTAVAATLGRPIAGRPYDSIAVPIAGGAALLLLVASFGPISGAHFNPAVTIGLAANGRFPRPYVLVYVLAQFAGAIGAALVIWAFVRAPRSRPRGSRSEPAGTRGLGVAHAHCRGCRDVRAGDRYCLCGR